MKYINIHYLLVLFILIAFNLNINAQNDKFGVREPEIGKRYDYAFPNFKARTGLEIKRGAISGRVFSPEQAAFEISVSHACLHPLAKVEYSGDDIRGMGRSRGCF